MDFDYDFHWPRRSMPCFVTLDGLQVNRIAAGHIPYLKSQQHLAIVNKVQQIRKTFDS